MLPEVWEHKLRSVSMPQDWERRALKAVTLKGTTNVERLIKPQRHVSCVFNAMSMALQHSCDGGPPRVIVGTQTVKPAAQFIASSTVGLGATGVGGFCPETMVAAISNVATRKIMVVV